MYNIEAAEIIIRFCEICGTMRLEEYIQPTTFKKSGFTLYE